MYHLLFDVVRYHIFHLDKIILQLGLFVNSLFWNIYDNPEVSTMDYVDRLTALREDRDVGQKEVAAILGCKQAAVSKYELRQNRYAVDDIIKLCKFYQVSADYVLGLPRDLDYPER